MDKWAAKGLHREREVLLGRIGSMRKKESGVGLASEPRFGQHLGVLRVDAEISGAAPCLELLRRGFDAVS